MNTTLVTLGVLLAYALSGGSAHRLDKLTLGDAAALHGQVVRVTFAVGLPVDQCGRWTIAGVDAGGVERMAVVPNGAGAWQGDTLTVVGVLRVVDTSAAVVNGQNVPAFTSVVVTGARVK